MNQPSQLVGIQEAGQSLGVSGRAILSGRVARIEKGDPRGTKYLIEGVAMDEITPVGSVGRFASGDRYLIITVYEVTEV